MWRRGNHRPILNTTFNKEYLSKATHMEQRQLSLNGNHSTLHYVWWIIYTL